MARAEHLPHKSRISSQKSGPKAFCGAWKSYTCAGQFPEFGAMNTQDFNNVYEDPERAAAYAAPDQPGTYYRETHSRAGLAVEAEYRPLGRPGEGFDWVSETTVPPWVIWVLKRA
jgi:hypothetical protein